MTSRTKKVANTLVEKECHTCGNNTLTKNSPGKNGVVCLSCKEKRNSKNQQKKNQERIQRLLDKYLITEENLISCKVCGFKTLRLAYQHLKRHDLTQKEYMQKFPGSPVTAQVLREGHSIKRSGKNHHFFGKSVSEERREKTSQGVKTSNESRKRICKNIHCKRDFFNPLEEYCKTCRSKMFIKKDTKELIRCRICSIGCCFIPAHLRLHNLSVDEYLLKFPDAELVSEALKEQLSKSRNPLRFDLKQDEYGKRDYGPNWRLQSRRAHLRDKHTCQHCSKTKKNGVRICVHHKVPFLLFDGYEEANQLDNLICLCTSCHQKEEHRFWEAFTHKQLMKFSDKIDQVVALPKIKAWLSNNQNFKGATT